MTSRKAPGVAFWTTVAGHFKKRRRIGLIAGAIVLSICAASGILLRDRHRSMPPRTVAENGRHDTRAIGSFLFFVVVVGAVYFGISSLWPDRHNEGVYKPRPRKPGVELLNESLQKIPIWVRIIIAIVLLIGPMILVWMAPASAPEVPVAQPTAIEPD